MPLSYDTNPVHVAEVEITSEFILTEVATALGADILSVGQVIPLLKQGTKYNPTMGTLYLADSVYLAIQPHLSHPSSSTGLENALSLCRTHYESTVNGVPTLNNSSSPTMMSEEPSSVSKPVTLTLKGQQKPNTLTKVPPKKSSQSLKPKKKPIPTNPLWAQLVENPQWS